MSAVARIVEPDPLPAEPKRRSPTDEKPLYRLRVFDLCWPWRETRAEVTKDALASGNARFDEVDRCVYLDAVANIQRWPPHRSDYLRWRDKRGGRSF